MRNDNSITCRALFAVALLTLAACAQKVAQAPTPVTPARPGYADAADYSEEEAGAEGAEAAAGADGQAASDTATADNGAVQLQSDAPLKYVVQKGDTLWAISQKFLKDAWQWPELWYVNEQVANPHLIYPGDVLYLFWNDGRPQLAKEGQGPATVATQAGPMDKLSPRVRELPLGEAIAAIPRSLLAGFLRGPRIIDDLDTLEDAPYVLDFEDPHLMNAAASDELAYVLELEDPAIRQYQIVRKGKRYIDPDDGDTIGWEAIPVAHADVRVFADPGTVVLTRSDIETRPGDRLLPIDPNELDAAFYPHAPAKAVNGTIIDVFNGDSQIGQYQIIAINRGRAQGIEPGHVLSVLQSGRKSKDPHSLFGRKVLLPDVNAGTVMVFKSTERVSLALVMTALRQIHVGDKVEKPEPSSP